MSEQYQQIITFIGGCSEEHLRSIYTYAGERLRHLSSNRQRQLTNTFNYGDEVFFIHKGIRYNGKVVKINATTVKVDVDGLVWKCSPGLLHHIPDELSPTHPVIDAREEVEP